MAIHSNILAWRIPWTDELGGLQSTGSQRGRHDRATKRSTHEDLWWAVTDCFFMLIL